MRFAIAFLLLGLIVSKPSVAADEVRFDRDVRPILSDKCFYCHGPDAQNRQADLRLDLEDHAREVIGDTQWSDLVARITTQDAAEVMPPPGAAKRLSADEIQTLTRWVAAGGEWSGHWSFLAPIQPELAEADEHPIDQIIDQRLHQHGLIPTGPASRQKLIRRVTYDLTGMPPTLAEIDDFLADQSANAYERVVDRLLASQRYGQRMALMWLDAARYGDTSVYHADGPRDMWAWRDAIVDAYNANMPFDEFSISQIAGDLLPDATLQQQVLAGFNRNNGTTDEGGAIPEEYRVEYAVDRVKTTSTVWLGLTMECAQCHDHKFDPISQEDYYRFYAFFNISRDEGMQTRSGNAEPKLDLLDPQKQEQIPHVEQELTAAEQRRHSIESSCHDELARWIEQQLHSGAPATSIDGRITQLLLSEGSGAKVADLVAADRAGTIHGPANWVKTRTDWGVRFSGDNYVDLGDVGDFERSDEFSYGGWFKPQPDTGGAVLARMDDGNAFRGYDLYVANRQVAMHLIHKWPDNAIKVTTRKKLEPDQWYHIFVTYDGSSKASGVTIYVNGEPWEWDVNVDGLTGTTKTDKTLLVGSRHPGSRLKGVVDEIEMYDRLLGDGEVKQLANGSSIAALLGVDAQQRTDQQNEAIRRYYLTTQNADYQAVEERITELNNQLAELRKPLTSVMIMRDMESPRETFILNRGAYDSPTDRKVDAGTPGVLPPMADRLPRNRLGLAEWLFQENHPLTARVAVNRYWQMLFGRGLVTTPEDFGAQGGFPTHPELLDWLAVDFRQSGWDVKRMMKQLVMSAAYQRSSQATSNSYKADPFNQWLARGPRFRLQGEFIRDTALQLSGLLVDTQGGPGVKPYQPPGLWAEVGLGGNPKFQQDHGDKLYRRSLYTYWKRSAPPPAMQIFDAPTREKCTIQRARTNTPLQALVTLNDTQFVEASRHFAKRMVCEGGDSQIDRISYGFRLATARQPDQDELQVLAGILTSALARYEEQPQAADELLQVGDSPRDDTLPAPQLAAWTIVASTILNLDETLTRE